MMVLYTADVERAQEVYDLGGLILHVESAYLMHQDTDGIYQKLTDKICAGERLDEEELMQLMILPLTVKGSRAKQVMIEKTVELVCQIPDREQTLKALAGILTFSDKVIDEDYKNRIKEEMRMTQIGQMIFSDGVLAGKAEGIGIGEDCFAALTEKLIRDSRLNELEMAAKDKALRAALYREYGIML